MGIINTIIEKLKFKELIAIITIASLGITLMPFDIIKKFGLIEFKESYQMYISLCLIICCSYYILGLIGLIYSFIIKKFFSLEKTGINYMKNNLSADEMGLIIEIFYDKINDSFRTTGYINYSDGRKAALEYKHIIYRASQMSNWDSFAYNLQPYALKFLNKNLKNGNIKINGKHLEWILV